MVTLYIRAYMVIVRAIYNYKIIWYNFLKQYYALTCTFRIAQAIIGVPFQIHVLIADNAIFIPFCLTLESKFPQIN